MTLQPSTFQPLPLGAVKPCGWLHDQLQLQTGGLTGHLDEFWPSVKDSRWIGGQAEGWERGPYWLDGLIPLAFLLDDERLKAKAQKWVDHILREQHTDGWLGAKDDAHEGEGQNALDPWPLFVLFKALLQWREAALDERIVPALLRCARRVQILLETEPLCSWARLRWADFVWSLQRLYELSGETWLLELSATCQKQGYDWWHHFADLPAKEKTRSSQLGEEVGLPLHGVNNAMSLKTGAVWWRQSGRAPDLVLARLALEELDRFHGSATGMFNADEHLAGLSPSQGFETCAVVEEMFSLEVAGAVTGDAVLFDRLEQIAFNALPGCTTPDFWAHQYHGQTNQVLCSLAPREWTDSGPRANLYGQDVNFGCCQANVHQGWPKFAANLWMRCEGGLAAVAFAPCEVEAEVNGTRVRVEETTNYPFEGEVRFVLHPEQPTEFALRLRVPAWAQGATWQVGNGARHETAGEWIEIERTWHREDEVTLRFPLAVRAENRSQGAVALHRGPLLLALRISEEFRALGSPYAAAEPRAQEWEVHPRSPWNYALAAGDAAKWPVRENGVGAVPWSPHAPPLVVEAAARRVSNWELHHHSAAPPASNSPSNEQIQSVELVPFGCTHLRVAEFPRSTP